jgi:hypothetical protein
MTGLRDKIWSKPQIKNHKKLPELRMIRPQTQYEIPEHMYLKFLTPLRPSMEKIMKFYGFQ